MNDVLRPISDFSRLGGVSNHRCWTPPPEQRPHLLHLAVLVAWTIVAGGLAARLFRWE